MTVPFERVATTGERALATWGELKTAGRGVPVVIGDDQSVGTLGIAFSPEWPIKRSLAEILSAAEHIRHPEDLVAYGHLPTRIVVDRDGRRRELTREKTRAAMLGRLASVCRTLARKLAQQARAAERR